MSLGGKIVLPMLTPRRAISLNTLFYIYYFKVCGKSAGQIFLGGGKSAWQIFLGGGISAWQIMLWGGKVLPAMFCRMDELLAIDGH